MLIFSFQSWSQCKTPDPVNKDALLGTWKGNFSSNGELVTMTMKVSKEGGNMVALVNVPSQKTKNSKYGISACASHFHIKKTENENSIEFKANQKENSLSGNMTFKSNNEIVSTEAFALRKVK